MIALILPLLVGDVTVTLSAEGRVRGTKLALGDVAQVAGEDPAEVARVAATELGYAPLPGFSRLLQADKLAQTVQRAAGVAPRFLGSPWCRVWPETTEVDAERLAGVARAELLRSAEGLDVEAVPRDGLAPVLVPAGVEGVRLEARLALRELRSGPLNVPVNVLVDGERWRTVWTSWELSIFEERTVLARDVRAGELLGPDDFRVERVRVSAPGADNPARGVLVGSPAARDLKAGSVLSDLDVHRPLAVRRGDTLYLQARKGMVKARVPAVAREDGRVGDRIVVAPLSGGREMSALIVSRELVEIDLGR